MSGPGGCGRCQGRLPDCSSAVASTGAYTSDGAATRPCSSRGHSSVPPPPFSWEPTFVLPQHPLEPCCEGRAEALTEAAATTTTTTQYEQLPTAGWLLSPADVEQAGPPSVPPSSESATPPPPLASPRGGGYEGVEVMQVGGHRVVVVSRQVLSRLACECFRRINHLYRASHLKQLREVFNDPGASNNDRFVCLELLHNACLSSEWKLPMCQDTGTAIVMAKKGEYVWTEGAEPDEEALSRGIYDAYTKYNFRYSQNAPLAMCSEKNTRTNLPAQIDISAVKGDTYEFLFMAKGGGSSNKTFLFQETAAILNPSSLLNFVRQNIHKLGTSACPPYHLALVIGGTSPEMNLKTVKLASAHSLDELPTSGSEQGRAFRDLEFESLVLRVCQECGVGAQFGGKYYALDVRVIRLSRHGASCPIGLGVSCSADRQMKAKITAQGIFVEKLETCPSKYLPSDEVQRQVYSALVTPIDLNVPMADIVAQLDKLKPGSRVSLTGSLIVARDLAHAWFMSELSTKGSLPEYLKNHIVYYAGPAKTPEGMASGSFGPTTAGRMDSYLPQLMAHGASLVTLAKGDRSQLVTDCCKQYGGFYLGSIGGPAAKLASECILNVSLVDCGHLGMEAVWKIQVQNFPAFVIVDNKGNNMFSS